jgi:hypothetical protein
LACELEVDLAPVSAGLAAREGEIFSRNFANIFFNMTGKGSKRLRITRLCNLRDQPQLLPSPGSPHL